MTKLNNTIKIVAVTVIVTLGIVCAYLHVSGAVVRGGAMKASVNENEINNCIKILKINGYLK